VGQPAPPRPTIATVTAKKFKLPPGNAVLGAVQKVRPRMIYNAAGFEALKSRAQSDEVTKAMLASVKATGEKILELPELVQVRGEAAKGGNDPSTKLLSHLSNMAVLNYVEGDPRWKDYAVREMVSIASFTNWHPEEPENCAQFVWAMSLGYDWFRTAMSAKDNAKIKAAIIELGMDALVAHLKKEPMPATTKRPEPGTTAAPVKKAAKGPPPKKPDPDEPVTTDDMMAATALLHAAMSLAEDSPPECAAAASLAMKTFDKGILQFAPDGIWQDGGVSQGDRVLDIVGSLIMSLRAATGGDFGLTTFEGLAHAADARVHIVGPTGSIFNYGDATSDRLNRPWVTSLLASFYGNPGVPAQGAAKPQAPDTPWLSLGGLMMYHNPHIAGYATPSSLDYRFDGAQVATLRSAWGDPKAWFIGVKGGENSGPGTQLDLGTFVLDAGGVRWAIDLGTESDRVLKPGPPTEAKFKNYRENTMGQNTWRFSGAGDDDKDTKGKKAPPPKSKVPVVNVPPNGQAFDAKADIVGFDSTAERGVAIIDMSKAYPKHAKDFRRGAMINRAGQPYALIQDELQVKGKGEPTWVMHTRADAVADGNKATLTSGGQTLTMTVLSPAGATVSVEELKDEDKTLRPNDQVGSFKGIKVIKVAVKEAKGTQTVAVAFTMGDAPAPAVVPLAQWIAKKK
jgi:hypothetical protein